MEGEKSLTERKAFQESNVVAQVKVDYSNILQQETRDKEQKKETLRNTSLKRSVPKAARSAFMCFSLNRKKCMERDNNPNKDDENAFEYFSNEWNGLSNQERSVWEEEARKDKLRFAQEKATFSDAPKRRAKKHPLAPKRPMSAFLKFSKTRRRLVKQENPHICNTDVSRLLGEMWRNADPLERDPYIKEEAKERIEYKAKIAKFRNEQAKLESLKKNFQQEDPSFPVKSVEISNYQSYQQRYDCRKSPDQLNSHRVHQSSYSFSPGMNNPNHYPTYQYPQQVHTFHNHHGYNDHYQGGYNQKQHPHHSNQPHAYSNQNAYHGGNTTSSIVNSNGQENNFINPSYSVGSDYMPLNYHRSYSLSPPSRHIPSPPSQFNSHYYR